MINIGGVAVTPKDGFTVDRNKLEERDSAFLTTFNTRAERFEPYDIAIINNIDEQFIVQSDNVIKMRDGLYEHDITLIEAIATFDGFYPADRIFSSDPPKTLGEVLTVYKTELQKYHNLLITFDEEADWTETLIIQKEFVGVNFGVIVADLFRTLDAKPRAEFKNGEWEIFPDFYNERNNLITPNPVSDLLTQDNIDYATKIKTQIKNGVYELTEQRFFPSENGTILPKSTTPQRADSRLEYTLDSGIVEITNAVAVDVALIFNKSVTGTDFTEPFNVTLDISEHIVPKQVWDGLPTPAEQISVGVHKKNSLFYDIGGRSIRNLFIPESEQLFFGFSDNNRVLVNALIETAFENNILIPEINENIQDVVAGRFRLAVDTDLKDVRMRFRYIPQRSFDVVHHRQYIKNMNEITQIHRQRDSQTEVSRYKNVLKNLSNRMGNDIKQLSQIFPDGNTFDLGDYDLNDNVVVRVKNTFYNDYVLCEFMMAEGFGNIDGEAALWKEPSPFEILGKDITTNLIFEDFIEFSNDSKPIDTRLSANARESILATLDPFFNEEPPIRAAVFRPILTEGATLVSTTGVYLPAFTGGGGNTTSFHFQIDDPVSAGRAFSETFEDDRFGLDLIYTESDTSTRFGELDDFFMFLIPDVDFDDDGFYPLIPTALFNGIASEAQTSTSQVETINKDKNAKFAVTFQQHFITDDPNIIIGPALAKYNRMASDRTIPTMEVFRSDKPYSIFDNKIRSGDVQTTGSISVNENTRQVTSSAVALVGQPTFRNVAFAYNDEIVLAINNQPQTNKTFFINFVSAADRVIVNQIVTPNLFALTAFEDRINITVTNPDDEEVIIQATLGSDVQTKNLQPFDGNPLNTNNFATFSFEDLTPETSYTIFIQGLPIVNSEKVASAPAAFGATTTPPRTGRPNLTINTRNVIGLGSDNTSFNIGNTENDDVDMFISRTPNPDENNNEFSISMTPNQTIVRTYQELFGELSGQGEEKTIYARAKSETKQISLQRQLDYTSSYRLREPVDLTQTIDDTSITNLWRSPNAFNATLRVQLFEDNELVDTFQQTVGANSETEVTFSGLTPDTDYELKAQIFSGFAFLFDSSIREITFKTLKELTATPTIEITGVTENTVSFDLTNNDSETAQVFYGRQLPTSIFETIASGETASKTQILLEPGTDYTMLAFARVQGKEDSEVAEEPFRTLTDFADQWELVGVQQVGEPQLEHDETLLTTPTPLPPQCPTDEQDALAFLNNAIPANTRRIGHIVRATAFAQTGTCTTYYFAAIKSPPAEPQPKYTVRARVTSNVPNVLSEWTVGSTSSTQTLTTSYTTLITGVSEGVSYSIEVPDTITTAQGQWKFVRFFVNGNPRLIEQNPISGLVVANTDIEAEYEVVFEAVME